MPNSPCTCHELAELKIELQIWSRGAVVVVRVHPFNNDPRVPNASFLQKKKYISVNSVCSKQYVFLKHLYIASNKFIILDRYFAQLLKINLYRQNCLYDIHVYGLNNITILCGTELEIKHSYIQILPADGIQKR